MKVLHILNELKWSGAEMMLTVGASHFEQHNIEIYILAKASDFGPFASEMEKVGFKVVHIPFRPRYKLLFNVLSLVRFIKSENIDVVHIHAGADYLISILSAKLAGVKRIIRTIHSAFFLTGIRQVKHYNERSLARILGVQHFSISHTVQQTELERFNNPTKLILNWFDEDRFINRADVDIDSSRRKLNIPTDKFIIVLVGNGSDIKNYWFAIDALAEYELMNVHLLFLGQESESFPESKYALSKGVNSYCTFTGPVNNVEEYLEVSDAFLSTSKFEGLGNSCLEALSMGLPCIVPDVHGLRDFRMYMEKCLFYYDISNLESLMCEIKNVVNLDNSVRLEIKEIGHSVSRKFFSSRVGVLKYISAYSGSSEKSS